MKPRRPVEEMSMSFLDVICCGFGAVILLLMTTKFIPPNVLEASQIHGAGTVTARENALFEIRGEVDKLTRELSEKQRELDSDLQSLAQLERDLSNVLGRYSTSKTEAEEALITGKKLAQAKQSLSEEMERLLGAGFMRSDNTVGGIAADSEYVVFVIDTSGSMFNYAWKMVMRKLGETLAVYPNLKGIQVMSDQGEYMFPQYSEIGRAHV